MKAESIIFSFFWGSTRRRAHLHTMEGNPTVISTPAGRTEVKNRNTPSARYYFFTLYSGRGTTIYTAQQKRVILAQGKDRNATNPAR